MTAVMVDSIDGEYVERPAPVAVSILDAMHAAAGLCRYGEPGTCTRVASHVVESLTESGPHAGHLARLECCVEHANYYAHGWLAPLLLYPGMRGSVWMQCIGVAS